MSDEGKLCIDKLTKVIEKNMASMIDFKQSTKMGLRLNVDKRKLNRIIENIYNGGGIDD